MGLNFQGEIPVFVDHKREDLLHNIKRINNEYSECYKTTPISLQTPIYLDREEELNNKWLTKRIFLKEN